MRQKMSAIKNSIIKQKKYTPKSLHGALIPMKMSASIMGLGIFEYPLGVLWTKTSMLWGLMCFTWGITSLFYLRPTLPREEGTSTNIIDTAMAELIIYVRAIDHFSIPIFAWTRQKKLRTLIDRISQSDARLFILNIKSSYRNLFFWQIVLIVFTILHNAVITIVCTPRLMQSDLSVFLKINILLYFWLPNYVCMVFDTYFVVLVSLLGKRFSQLNDLLRSLIPAPEIPQHKKVLEYTNRLKANEVDSITNNYGVHDDEVLMNKIRSVHLELVRLGQSVNSVFGIRILSSMIMVFCLLCTLLYRLWTVTTSDASIEEKLEEQKFIIMWLTFHLYKLLLINIICGRTSNLAKQTGDIICELHEPSANLKFREEITDFVLQIVQNKLVFSPCGLIDLNNARIASMIGSITTLLVIVVQIGDTSIAKSDNITATIFPTNETPMISLNPKNI